MLAEIAVAQIEGWKFIMTTPILFTHELYSHPHSHHPVCLVVVSLVRGIIIAAKTTVPIWNGQRRNSHRNAVGAKQGDVCPHQISSGGVAAVAVISTGVGSGKAKLADRQLTPYCYLIVMVAPASIAAAYGQLNKSTPAPAMMARLAC
jgi:hypothetical protein